jgi:two-component system OmpR family response regulator/two-component system response regulator TctD
MLQKIIDGEIETSVSGEDALSRIKEKTFDIIITDISMPGIGGEELINHIRKLDLNILIVAMSGWMGNLEGQNSLGADYTLSKPFTIDDLQIMITKLYKSKNDLIV